MTFDLRRADRFLVRATIPVPASGEIPAELDGGAIYSDAEIGTTLTCGSSRAVGTSVDVQARLGTDVLARNGLDGTGVAIAIVDGGIALARLGARLGTPPRLDAGQSWSPPTRVSVPGLHRVGHGTMCAYDALIAAPRATLLDIPALGARAAGDHGAAGTIGAAIQAYWFLITRWVLSGPPAGLRALVVSNSWGIYHPSLDFPEGHPGRYVDNPDHPFRAYVRALTLAGIDVVFAGSNCGPECPAAPCLQRVQGAIMGANTYPEVLTLAACTVAGERLGYSATGPSIAGMMPRKPDVMAYSHFLGSQSRTRSTPDGGTSAACAVRGRLRRGAPHARDADPHIRRRDGAGPARDRPAIRPPGVERRTRLRHPATRRRRPQPRAHPVRGGSPGARGSLSPGWAAGRAAGGGPGRPDGACRSCRTGCAGGRGPCSA